jgi:AraC family ethanolamine operon transcriptional activator
MPTRTFSSFEAMFAAHLHADLRGMVLGRDSKPWVMTQLVLNNLSVQWGHPGAGVATQGATPPAGITFYLPTQSPLGFSGNGHPFDEFSLMINRPGDEFYIINASSRPWFSVYIPYATLAGASEQAIEPVPSMHGVVQLPLPRIQRFQSLIGQFGEAAQRAATDFESAAAQKAAEQKLIPEIRTLLAVPQEAEPMHGRHAIPRRQVIRRSLDFVEQHEGEYLSVEQLAAAAGVSERTLRDAFQHYFGLAPVRYLNRRTLHQARKALKAADPSVATVTEIAAQCGVWQLGRFARDYRALFGELPSETLRQLY